MAVTDRDLVAALRSELAAVDPARPCDRRAELAGLGAQLVTREAAVARLAVRLGGRAAETRPHAVRRRFTMPDGELEWSRAPEHCRLAWLRGRFLSCGSLSLAAGRAHLEFTLPEDEAGVLAARLGSVGLPASIRVRRGAGVVTWKSSETITVFLSRIGASAALLELQARGVARSLRGDLNRVINAESANLQRSVAAAGRQLAAIDALDADGRLDAQPYTVRAVAEARRETPEASLSEIAVRLELHRSSVQRALERIELLALHDDGGAGLRRGRDGRAGRGGEGMQVVRSGRGPSGPGAEAAGRRREVRASGSRGPSGRGVGQPRLA